MKTKLLTRIALLSTLSTFSLTIAAPLVAQDVPAQTYQPGFWQPIARVNLKRPVTIKLINETDVPIEYGLSNNSELPPTSISPGDNAVMAGFPIPAYVLINFVSSASDQSDYNLKFDVVVDQDNVVIVKVQKINGDIPGNTTLNLHETGAIYIY
ncbi:MAG: hypothetical protein ACRDEA_18100 [Microcystaceae cyanobacterium]